MGDRVVSFQDLRSFLQALEKRGLLARVNAEVDSDQEITIIQHRLLTEGGPAILFEHVKGSPYRLVSNLFGTPERVQLAFGRPPREIGEEIAQLAHRVMPPSLANIWAARSTLWHIAQARLRNVQRGPILEQTISPPRLDQLPVLTCWPLDGGAFFTLPLVHTVDPRTGVGNLGIYRMQRFDATSTGMHWQIEKGGGFHFRTACERGEPLRVSVFLGGPPALTLAAIAPLPEGVDERLLAALIMGRPLDVIQRPGSGHRIPANAEFVLEGTVTAGDMRQEGPFGDHLGHYSHSAQFPVFRIERMLARKDAIYPATVVGKPPQEDYFIGEALQEMTLPLLKLIRPAISNVWAYPETGFHPLAVAAVKERYPREALKHALGLLGEGQLSLTKILMVVNHDVDVRNFRQVSRALWENLDAAEGLHLLAPTAQDTLDFTGPAMNSGSRLIMLATRDGHPPLRTTPPPPPPAPGAVHAQILGLAAVGEAFLVAQVADGADRPAIRLTLAEHPATKPYLFHVLVSKDVPLNDPRLILWGWFTRFDPLADLYPARREVVGNRMVLHFPIAIDATWKTGYRLPVAFDPEREQMVEHNWSRYGFGKS
ncbi:MAG: UbiD family decarboxylase [Verrucomicrobia bacterium]|nr:MAG: UbiD family decarboxylase [Verrucomicrobiota bacterium]